MNRKFTTEEKARLAGVSTVEYTFWLVAFGAVASLLVICAIGWFSIWFVGLLGVERWLSIPLFVLLVGIWSGGGWVVVHKTYRPRKRN